MKLNAPEKEQESKLEISQANTKLAAFCDALFINWNPIFSCTGLFLPNKHTLLAVWQPEKKGPLLLYLREIFTVCML